jgi:hypothetical protein
MGREINPVRGKKRFNLDVVGRLQQYFPIFFELLGDNPLKWKTVEKVLAQKIEVWKAKAGGKTIRVQASFYNIITASIEGNAQATGHLDFIKKLFEELILRLDTEERKFVVPALFGMLSNVDNKFWNFVGELLVLNNFKKHTQLRLTAVEVLAMADKPDGSRIDFQFFDKEGQSTLLLEVVNVHVHGCSTWADEQINHIIHQKIQHKLNKTGVKSNQKFWLVPVFWGSYEDLARVNSFYISNDIKFQNTTEPTSFVSFTIGSSTDRVHMFGTIGSIVEFYDSRPLVNT